jgi:aminobenzoyl-glutamate utilization protein A
MTVDEDVVAIRRELHANPELGFLEFRTAGRVAKTLESLGFQLTLSDQAMVPEARLGVPDPATLAAELEAAAEDGVEYRWLTEFEGGMTAVVGTLPGPPTGPVTAFRFDIDALPVTEDCTAEHAPARLGFASSRPGLMHACGHDGHVAIGLALAARLSHSPLPGTVKLVFQPAEEGLRGGSAVAAAGVLADVDRLYCLHLGLGLPTGTVHGSVAGLIGSTKLRAEFKGRAAHAGVEPERGANALLAAAQAVVGLHALPQYFGEGARLNVGRFEAGTAANVVAERATLVLETRQDRGDAGSELAIAAERVLGGAGVGLGVEVEVERVGGAPAVECDPEAAAAVEPAVVATRGLHYAGGPHRDRGSEDASWLLDAVRDGGGTGTYIAFGCTSPSGHHTPRFDLDERALPPAVDMLHRLASAGGR